MTSVLEMALEALQGMRDMWASVCISHGWEPNHLSQYDDAGKAIAALKEAIKQQEKDSRADYCGSCGQWTGGPVICCHESESNPKPLITKAEAKALREAIKNQGGMCAKEQAFKDYVHQRLDAMGVPHSVPESEHDKAGCRIGGRLDYVEAKLKSQGEPVAWLSPNGLQASTSRMLNGTPLCHCTSVPAGEPVARVVIKTGDISFYLAEWLREPNDGDLLYTSAPTIPEGWQLVPVAPTPKMIHEGQMSRLCPVTGSESAAAIYKAMLSAAPKGDKP